MTVKRIIGPTILLHSGEYFDFENVEAASFNIVDIAHALSNICRYTGHCKSFYSVAQHSVLVSLVVPKEDALAGLLHDAAEAFVSDMAKPLKMIMPEYQAMEQKIESALFRKFGLPETLPDSVMKADRILLRTEQRDLMNADNHIWKYTEGEKPLEAVITPMLPSHAKRDFLMRYEEITGWRN